MRVRKFWLPRGIASRNTIAKRYALVTIQFLSAKHTAQLAKDGEVSAVSTYNSISKYVAKVQYSLFV